MRLKTQLLASLLVGLLSLPALAGFSFKAPNASLQINGTDAICKVTTPEFLGVVSQLEGLKVEQMKTATVVFQGQRLQACWIDVPGNPGWVLVIDETGDGGVIQTGLAV